MTIVDAFRRAVRTDSLSAWRAAERQCRGIGGISHVGLLSLEQALRAERDAERAAAD